MRALGRLAAILALSAILGGCMAGQAAGPLEPPAPTEEPVFQPVPPADTVAATPPPLTEGEIGTALRDLVCWYADPELARTCLPPGEEFVAVLQRVALSGDQRFVAPLVDMLWLELGWERWVREALELLTGERHTTAAEWYAWMQATTPPLPDGYADWKGSLLALVDPLFSRLIRERTTADGPGPEELVWGLLGVAQVPPLVAPDTVHRVEERYLARSDVVYGVVIDGVARAYPERIVAWHGVVSDEVGGVPLLVWHCTSCGGAAVFNATASDGRRYTFAPSGLVWEGRRQLFDDETASLWDAVSGRAIAGPASGASLTPRPVIRTTWGEWSDRYRNTRVLSLDTGFVRDYSEGAAIRADVESATPVFPVVTPDDRLPPKTRVVGLIVDSVTRAYPLERVEASGILHDAIGGRRIVLISAGPGRGVTAFEVGGTTFERVEGSGEDRELVDADGVRWFMDEERLLNTRNSRSLPAVATRVIYWFAWTGAYPDTDLWR